VVLVALRRSKSAADRQTLSAAGCGSVGHQLNTSAFPCPAGASLLYVVSTSPAGVRRVEDLRSSWEMRTSHGVKTRTLVWSLDRPRSRDLTTPTSQLIQRVRREGSMRPLFLLHVPVFCIFHDGMRVLGRDVRDDSREVLSLTLMFIQTIAIESSTPSHESTARSFNHFNHPVFTAPLSSTALYSDPRCHSPQRSPRVAWHLNRILSDFTLLAAPRVCVCFLQLTEIWGSSQRRRRDTLNRIKKRKCT
jgi:hypothetical protein